MVDRKGHYLAPPTRPTIPGVWFGVVVDSLMTGHERMPHVTTKVWQSAAVAVSYRKRTGWTRPEVARIGKPEALHEWMHERSLAGRVNWVVCPIASEVLTLSLWWKHATVAGSVWRSARGNPERVRADHSSGNRIVFDRLTVKGSTDIIRYATLGRRWQWCSVTNWFPRDTGRNGADSETDGPNGFWSVQGSCCSVRRSTVQAVALVGRVTGLCDWWRGNARAGFGPTLGTLALGMIRSFAPPRVMCTHSDADAKALERSAGFGGRASVWFVGRIGDGCGVNPPRRGRNGEPLNAREPGPVTQVDVRSMYGSIMRDFPLPVKLIRYTERVSVPELVQTCERFGVLARVLVSTPVAEYPLRRGERVLFPTGRFLTTLTGPEIQHLLLQGQVLECQAMCVYHNSSVLSLPASSLLNARSRAALAGRASDACFLKLLLNAMPGKLSQRAGRWVRSPDDDEPGRWGEGRKVSRKSDRTIRYRYVCGLAWRFDDDEAGAGPYAAAFSYIAAYGRLMMANIRQYLRPRVVVSQDTDGLWVLGTNKQTLDALGPLAGEGPGRMRVVGSASNARFLGPRHYCVDGTWTLSGFAAPEVKGDACDVWDVVHPSLWNTRTFGPPVESHILTRKSRLRLDVAGGRVQPDGWVLPPYIL